MRNPEVAVEAPFHFLHPGCLEIHLREFTTQLKSAGYTALTIKSYEDSVSHFGAWMHRNTTSICDIDETVIEAFASHHCVCPGGRQYKRLSRRYVRRVKRFVSYLMQQGIVDALEEPDGGQPALLTAFFDWLYCHRGLSCQTVDRYEYSLKLLLPKIGADPARYDAASVRQAITSQIDRYSRSSIQGLVTALRAYLRFLAAQGFCHTSLAGAVPTCPQWKLSALPRYLVADEVERVIATCDRSTPCGLRNRAILLLLARLGLRAGDIVNLCLEDVDWNEGVVQVHGKGRRSVRLPLPQEVGDALLEYLQLARPAVPINQLFLCLQAPYRAFSSSVVVSGIVQAALSRASIVNPPSHGANLLRHSAATSMLRNGATLEAISTVLRHRSVNTTAHYAKVDLALLRPIAQPWPGVCHVD